VQRSLIEKPKGSNSMETRLSIVNWQTNRKFLTMSGTIRRLLRRKVLCEETERLVCPVEEIGKETPLPTVTWEGEESGVGVEIISGSEAIWEVAPESMIHSLGADDNDVPAMLFSAATRVEQSQAGGPCDTAGAGRLMPDAYPWRGSSMVL
jgi:hypothetical protein